MVHGLSPRARGNRSSMHRRFYCRGSIPACTGEPSRAAARSSPVSVYPRVHGGTNHPLHRPSPMGGLSPRARGNRFAADFQRICQRSIPACTGEPSSVSVRSDMGGVYPRVHGGTSPMSSARPLSNGLSPRARGNHGLPCPGCPRSRSIPACTGEPTTVRQVGLEHRVYPRVHGGTRRRVTVKPVYWGLSPRARGNLRRPWPYGRARRSIPACTGEPTPSSIRCSWVRVYPRVHGGTCAMRAVRDAETGLSPRARGNHAPGPCRSGRRRSIPACTGEPRRCRAARSMCRVYPRVHGGTERYAKAARDVRGLSPRARGNPEQRIAGSRSRGSIPACTGEPTQRTDAIQSAEVYPRVHGGTVTSRSPVSSLGGLSPRARGNR